MLRTDPDPATPVRPATAPTGCWPPSASPWSPPSPPWCWPSPRWPTWSASRPSAPSPSRPPPSPRAGLVGALLVDSFTTAASLVILWRYLRGDAWSEPWYAWTLVACATAVSVALNVAHAPDRTSAQLFAALPPVALLGALELLMSVARTGLRTPTAPRPRRTAAATTTTPRPTAACRRRRGRGRRSRSPAAAARTRPQCGGWQRQPPAARQPRPGP